MKTIVQFPGTTLGLIVPQDSVGAITEAIAKSYPVRWDNTTETYVEIKDPGVDVFPKIDFVAEEQIDYLEDAEAEVQP